MKTGQYNLLSDAIIDEMRARIRDGVWQPGMKIPREIELSRELAGPSKRRVDDAAHIH